MLCRSTKSGALFTQNRDGKMTLTKTLLIYFFLVNMKTSTNIFFRLRTESYNPFSAWPPPISFFVCKSSEITMSWKNCELQFNSLVKLLRNNKLEERPRTSKTDDKRKSNKETLTSHLWWWKSNQPFHLPQIWVINKRFKGWRVPVNQSATRSGMKSVHVAQLSQRWNTKSL